MPRVAIFCGLIAATATVTGAWALPSGQVDPPIAPVAAEPVAVAPAVRSPDISGSVERRTATPPTTTAAAGVDVHTEGPAAHLAVASPAPTPEVIAIVTTTTAPPPPPTTPTAAPASDVTKGFTASQAYGSCGEDIPYDIFSGTAAPGSTVTISSPYGSGSTTADGSGHWERKVEFPAAPHNEAFSVAVSGHGGSDSFSFMATGDAH